MAFILFATQRHYWKKNICFNKNLSKFLSVFETEDKWERARWLISAFIYFYYASFCYYQPLDGFYTNVLSDSTPFKLDHIYYDQMTKQQGWLPFGMMPLGPAGFIWKHLHNGRTQWNEKKVNSLTPFHITSQPNAQTHRRTRCGCDKGLVSSMGLYITCILDDHISSHWSTWPGSQVIPWWDSHS